MNNLVFTDHAGKNWRRVTKRDCFFRMFERVEVKKNRAYWFFGARFACEEEQKC